MFSGKKTYIAAAGAVLTAVGGVMTGTMDIPSAIQLVFTAILGATIRNGVAQTQK